MDFSLSNFHIPESFLTTGQDWIKSREAGDDEDPAEAESTSAGAAGVEGDSAKKGPPKQWIRAPNDATLRNTPCPICQETFESTWSEEVQDWIWQDAVKVGNRIYHASCYAEVTKDGTTTAAGRGTPSARTGTPDSVLGKRKAEVCSIHRGRKFARIKLIRRRGPTLLGPMSESRWSLRERQCFNQVRYPGPCFLLVPRGAACMRWSWQYTLCLVVAFSRRLYCILRACTILRRLGDFSLSTSITIPVFHTILHRTFHKPMAIPRMALILVPPSLFSLDSPR